MTLYKDVPAARNSVSPPNMISAPPTVPTLAVPWLESAASLYVTTNLVELSFAGRRRGLLDLRRGVRAF